MGGSVKNTGITFDVVEADDGLTSTVTATCLPSSIGAVGHFLLVAVQLSSVWRV